jgi:catechol-2,3-dioxygenase
MYLDELYLYSAHLPELADFYSQTLGLPISKPSDMELAIQAGTTRLVFQQAPAGWRGMYHFAFNIPRDLFDEARLWLESRTPLIPDERGRVEFGSNPEWDSRSCYFYDPAGNILELIARQRLDNAAPPPFDGGKILGVSEIGLASEDVPELAQRLKEAGFSIFGKDYDAEFTPMGDDHGLLILVRRGRKWYPNRQDPAELLPVRVLLRDQSGRRIDLTGVPYQIKRLE